MGDIFEKCEKFTEPREYREKGLYPYFIPIEEPEGPICYINGKRMIMLGSNNYLGLTVDERVKKAAMEAVEKYGTGSSGSRFLNGTMDIHVKLEKKLAKFVGKEDAIVFTTGYLVNLGTISALVGRNDWIIMDKLNHASLFDGAYLAIGLDTLGIRESKVKVARFKHNDMDDLKRVLEQIPKDAGKLIVVDGLFSMEGDLAKLPDIVDLAKRYNARVMVDDAHAIGVFGEKGSGTPEHFGLTDEVDLIMGTFSKSLASVGGFIAGPAYVIDYIRHFARPLIFTAAAAPAAVAAVDKALDICINEPERRKRLWENTKFILESLKELGFDTGLSESPIVPIIIGDNDKTFMFWKALFDSGVFTNAVISPAVPPAQSRLRTSYMATHTKEMLEEALAAFKEIGQKLGIIK